MLEYYNTNEETGHKLNDSVMKAKSQEDQIIIFFGFVEQPFTADEIWESVFNKENLLTSVRRAMSNLCTKGLLVKCEDMNMGLYGKMIHYYKKA